MRRKDREVTDDYQIDTIITSCNCCRLGFLRPRQRIYCSIKLWLREKAEHEFFYFHSAKTREKDSTDENESTCWI